MKRALVILLLLVCILTTLVSCVSVPYARPYGVWHNETIGLTLDINPSAFRYGHPSGTYIIGGEERKVYIGFEHGGFFRRGGFFIEDAVRYNDDGTLIPTLDRVYFSGNFRVRDGKLHYTLRQRSQERHGIIDTIVFEKIASYDVPG